MAGPGDESAAAAGQGDGRLRASHADREQVIEVLEVAFVRERLPSMPACAHSEPPAVRPGRLITAIGVIWSCRVGARTQLPDQLVTAAASTGAEGTA